MSSSILTLHQSININSTPAAMQDTSSSSGAATSLEPPEKDTIPELADTRQLRASFFASMIALSLDNFRHFVKQQYPLWGDMVALVDAVQETLRRQYGGSCPEDFIWDMYTNNIPLRSASEIERAVERWVDLPELSVEFQDFHPFRCSKGDPVDLSATLISEKVSFLRAWLEDAQTAQAYSD